MTTDNIIETPRDLEVLLRLNTHQDMTDEEINILIDYKVKVGVASEVSQQVINNQIEASNTLIETSLQAKNTALQRLQDIINAKTRRGVNNE